MKTTIDESYINRYENICSKYSKMKFESSYMKDSLIELLELTKELLQAIESTQNDNKPKWMVEMQESQRYLLRKDANECFSAVFILLKLQNRSGDDQFVYGRYVDQLKAGTKPEDCTIWGVPEKADQGQGGAQ